MLKLEDIIAKLKNHDPAMLDNGNYSKYSILLPLLQKKEGLHVLFEVRSLELRRQPGEICFPGGRIDSNDKNEKNAAIRETAEELGIDPNDLSAIFPIDFLISPFGMIMYPFVGLIKDPAEIKPNPAEVCEIFTVPLSYFFHTSPKIYQISFKPEPEANFPFELIPGGENYNWQIRKMEEYFYFYGSRTIWGLTARILAQFISIIK